MKPTIARILRTFLFLAGGFVLPLQSIFPAGPALLSLAALAAMRVPDAAGRPEVWAVVGGWTASFLWPGRPIEIMALIDLALIGPMLVFAAVSPASSALKSGLILGGLFLALIILAQSVMGHHVPLSWLGSAWSWPRAAGTLGNPNPAAAYLAAIMPLVWGAAWRRPLRCTALAALGAACLATGSRGGWMASWAGIAVYLWLRRSPALSFWILTGAALVILPWPPSARFLAVLGDDTAITARFDIWRHYISACLRKPWTGWGIMRNPHPHNLLLELAIIGGLPLLAGWTPAALKAARLFASRPPERERAAAGAALAALTVYGLWDAIVIHPVLYCLIWLNYGWFTTEGGAI